MGEVSYRGSPTEKKNRFYKKKGKHTKNTPGHKKYTRSYKKYKRWEEVFLKGLATGKKRHQVI